MSDTNRDRSDDSEPTGGAGWEGVPAGTSSSAAPGTEAAADKEGQGQPTGEGADIAREQYADQSQRAQQDLQDAGAATIGENESKPTSRPLGGPTSAPGPDATGLTTSGAASSGSDDEEERPSQT